MNQNIQEHFESWWHNEGSGIAPTKDEDIEEFAKRVTQIAWSNGGYVMQNLCSKLCVDASKPEPGEIQTDAQWAALTLAVSIRGIKIGKEK
jgi:hypothetical protein